MFKTEEIPKVSGKRIREIRLQNKLTQSALAELADLSVSYISHIETGRKTASFVSLTRIAYELNVTLDELLYGIQKNRSTDFQLEMLSIFDDCTTKEREILIKILNFHKKLIKEVSL